MISLALLFTACICERPLLQIKIISTFLQTIPSLDIASLDNTIQCIAQPCMLCCILLLIDGLAYAPEDELNLQPLPRSRSRNFDLLSVSQHGGVSPGNCLRRKHLAFHHPCASFSGDFYLPKLILLILLTAARLLVVSSEKIFPLSFINSNFHFLFLAWSVPLLNLPWIIWISYVREVFTALIETNFLCRPLYGVGLLLGDQGICGVD
jgi:hypothetical protein